MAIKKTDVSAESFLFSTRALTQILDVSKQRISQLLKEGLPKAGPDSWDIREVVPWLIDKANDQNATAVSEELAEARRRLCDSQRHRIDLELAERRAELLDAEDVRQLVSELALIVSVSLDSLAGRLGGELAGISDVVTIERTLMTEARAIRAAIAQRADALGDVWRLREARGAAAGVDGGPVGGFQPYPSA